MNTLEALVEKSTAHDQLKTDYTIMAKRVLFRGNRLTGTAWINNGDLVSAPLREPDETQIDLPLTEWALEQLYQKIAPYHYGNGKRRAIPREFINAFPVAARDQVHNLLLGRAYPNKTWMLRAFNNNGRAVLDVGYPRYGNTDMLQSLKDVMDEVDGYTLVRPYLTPDEVVIKIMWPDETGSHYRLGIAVINGEIGNRALEIAPLVQNTRCENSIIISADEDGRPMRIQIPHQRWHTRQSMSVIIKSQGIAALRGSALAVERALDAEKRTLPRFSDVIAGLANELRLDTQATHLLHMGTTGETVGGLVNGLTYAAQHAQQLSEDRRVALEVEAGKLLYAREHRFSALARLAKRERQEDEQPTQ